MVDRNRVTGGGVTAGIDFALTLIVKILELVKQALLGWLSEHAHEYGFIIRYPKDGTDETGYAYEPWHIRYLGDLAEDVYKSGLTLEAWYARRLGGSKPLQAFEFPVTELALKGLG